MQWPEHRHYSTNMTPFEHKSLRWLQEHEHSYKIVDTEKKLGNAIVCSRWLDGPFRKWLRKSMQVAPHYVLQLAKSRLSQITSKASTTQAISRQQA